MEVEQQLRQAEAALAGDRAGEAVARLKELLWRCPDNARAYTLLGVALHRRGELGEALQALERAHYLQPDNPVILFNYGLALSAAGRIDEARLRWEASLRLAPDYAEPRAALAESQPAAAPAGARKAAGGGALVRSDAEEPRYSSPLEHEAPAFYPSDEELIDPYEEEQRPGFRRLAMDSLTLAVNAPHLAPLLMLLPAAGAAAIEYFYKPEAWIATLVWVAAVALGGSLALPAMASVMIHGRATGGWPYAPRMLRTLLLLAPTLLFTAGLPAASFAQRNDFPPYVTALLALLGSFFFHALLAPAYMLSATQGPGGPWAVMESLRMAGRHTWLHLLLMVTLGAVAGGVLVFFTWLFIRAMGTYGLAIDLIIQVAVISIGASAWVVLTTVCGLDAIAQRRFASQREENGASVATQP